MLTNLKVKKKKLTDKDEVPEFIEKKINQLKYLNYFIFNYFSQYFSVEN